MRPRLGLSQQPHDPWASNAVAAQWISAGRPVDKIPSLDSGNPGLCWLGRGQGVG